MALFSKTDPCVTVDFVDARGSKTRMGQTETIQNDNDPIFTTKIHLSSTEQQLVLFSTT